MSLMSLVAGAEVLFFVVNLVMIRKNGLLLKEIRRCNDDLALALTLAVQRRYREAETAARRWAERMRAHKAGVVYEPPGDPTAADGWRGRFAP